MSATRDHGGGLDAAIARYGGEKRAWIDLSTGINPVPYPLGDLPASAWAALPDTGAQSRLEAAARAFWNVPQGAGLLAAPGASALIARLPHLLGAPGVCAIPGPTYNEWGAAFANAGWKVGDSDAGADVLVQVHPNNPDGRLAALPPRLPGPDARHLIYDESFGDALDGWPRHSAVARAGGQVWVVKSFGKFWGLAGLRLGFLIGPRAGIAAMAEALGPWPVSGPALAIGARALEDTGWAETTRARLAADAARLDALMQRHGAALVGPGTPLFRLYEVDDAAAWQERLAAGRVWTRIFPYSRRLIRLGLPRPDGWPQLEAAL